MPNADRCIRNDLKDPTAALAQTGTIPVAKSIRFIRGFDMKSTVAYLLAILVGAAIAPAVNAQGLDDLFSASPQRDTPQQDARRLTLPAPAPPIGASSGADETVAPISSPSDRRLTNQSGSADEKVPSMAMQIRQARAMEAYRQRQARLEASYWSSNPNLRPVWDMNMGGHYHNNRIVYYVPAYFYAR